MGDITVFKFCVSSTFYMPCDCSLPVENLLTRRKRTHTKKINCLYGNRFSNSVTYATVICTTLRLLDGSEQSLCPSDAGTATFHSAQNEASSFHVSNKELQCCYEEQDDVILFLGPDVTCSREQTERTDDTSCDAICR